MAQYDDSLDPRDPEIEYADEKRPLRDGYYGTGSTEPPKDHMGTISVVLALLISFSSLITALGLMNIQVFQVPQPTGNQPALSETLPGSVGFGEELHLEAKDPASTEPRPLDTASLESGNAHLQLNAAPQGIENTEPLPGALSWQAVYEKVLPSVVSITADDGRSTSTGTGVIMDATGYIITNAHVVEEMTSIRVLLTDGRELDAVRVGSDVLSDLAVLRVEARGLTPAEFGDSSSLRVGDAVVAIGDPLGVELRGTMTNGIISGINRDIRVGSRTMTLLQTTAALNAGNSGGPLVNCYGQVVGINTMKIGDYASEGGVEGLGFAIPMVTAQSVVEQLANHGYVAGRPTIGFEGEGVSLFHQVYYRMPAGVRITALEPDSNAAQQGLHRGDILLSLNGETVTEMEDVEQIVYACAVGDQLSAILYRNGTQFTLTITLDELKK